MAFVRSPRRDMEREKNYLVRTRCCLVRTRYISCARDNFFLSPCPFAGLRSPRRYMVHISCARDSFSCARDISRKHEIVEMSSRAHEIASCNDKDYLLIYNRLNSLCFLCLFWSISVVMAERHNLIFLYYSVGMSYGEILLTLAHKHNVVISERHLKRILRQAGVGRRKSTAISWSRLDT